VPGFFLAVDSGGLLQQVGWAKYPTLMMLGWQAQYLAWRAELNAKLQAPLQLVVREGFSLFRFSLSFARTQLARYRWFCVEAAPLNLLVGVLVHSGRRFLPLLSLSLFYASLATTTYFPISYYYLMRLFSCCGFLSFLFHSGHSSPAASAQVLVHLEARTSWGKKIKTEVKCSFPRVGVCTSSAVGALS
jgi:hypothetical protein